MSDELTIEQAQAIISKEDPRGEKYWRNDKPTVDAVNHAFERAHPGQIDLGQDPLLEDAMARAVADQQGMPPKDAVNVEIPEVAATNAIVDATLRAQFGNDFEEKRDLAFAVAEEIFGTKEKFVEFFVKYDLDLDAEKQLKASNFC